MGWFDRKRLACTCESDPKGRCVIHEPLVGNATARCFDRKTGDEVFIAGNEYSINGTEPMPIPGDLRHMEPLDIAKQILEIHLGRRRTA